MKSSTLTTWPGEMGWFRFCPLPSRADLRFRAAWHGSRIIMRQVSWEAQYIFDFILETHRACDGKWEMLAQQVGISHEALEGYLDYAAVFLANIGNYYVRVQRSTFYRPYQWRNREGATENLRQLYRQKTWRRYHTYPSTP